MVKMSHQYTISLLKKTLPKAISAIPFIATTVISFLSYKTYENQLIVSKISVEPHFYVDTIFFKNGNTGEYNTNFLKIFNIGAPVANIKAEVNTFYEIKNTQNKQTTLIPVIGYYSASSRTAEPKGLISTYLGDNNNSNNWNILYSADIHRDNTLDITLKTFTHIKYLSFDGVEKEQCFLDTNLLNCNEANKYKTPSNELAVQFYQLTYDSLIKKYHQLNLQAKH